jgi:hypothetical protein
MTRSRFNQVASVLPLVCSALAAAVVLANLIAQIAPSPDEGASAHIFQLLIVVQLPVITVGNLTDAEAAEIIGWSPEQVASIRRTYVDQGAVNMAIAARLRDRL